MKGSEMTYTPGPWFVNNLNDIMDERFQTFVGVSFRASEEERHANARIIAAAPEAIDTLKMLVAWWHETNSVKDILEAKALGYPPVIARAMRILGELKVPHRPHEG